MSNPVEPPCAPHTPAAVPAPGDDELIAVSLARILRDMTPRIVATPALMLACLAAHVALGMLGDDGGLITLAELATWGGSGLRVADGEVWRLLTAMFLHANALHLASNLLMLALAGYVVERLVGSIGLVVVFVLSGIAGALASALWSPLVIGVGASGAVYGIVGCMLGFYLVQRRQFPSSVLGMLAGGALALLLHAVAQGMAPAIDWAAHAGGLAVGGACGCLLTVPLDRRARALRLRKAGLAAAVVGAPLVLAAVAMQGLVVSPAHAVSLQVAADRAALAALEAPAMHGDAATLAVAVRGEVVPATTAAEPPAPYARAPRVVRQAFAYTRDARAARLRGWELLAQGLERDDAEGVAAALAAHRRADALIAVNAAARYVPDEARALAPIGIAAALEVMPAVAALVRVDPRAPTATDAELARALGASIAELVASGGCPGVERHADAAQIELAIGADGRVIDVVIHGVHDDALASCLEEQAGGLWAPRPASGDMVTLTLPLAGAAARE